MAYIRTERYNPIMEQIKAIRKDLAYLDDTDIIKILLQERIAQVLNNEGKQPLHNSPIVYHETHFQENSKENKFIETNLEPEKDTFKEESVNDTFFGKISTIDNHIDLKSIIKLPKKKLKGGNYAEI